jgi:hypothetical protein
VKGWGTENGLNPILIGHDLHHIYRAKDIETKTKSTYLVLVLGYDSGGGICRQGTRTSFPNLQNHMDGWGPEQGSFQRPDLLLMFAMLYATATILMYPSHNDLYLASSEGYILTTFIGKMILSKFGQLDQNNLLRLGNL